MIVKELIDRLYSFDENLLVTIEASDPVYFIIHKNIKEVSVETLRNETKAVVLK